MPVSIHQKPHRRAVVIAGNRTPFVRAFREYLTMDTIALGCAAVDGLLKRADLNKTEVDAVVWGGVLLPSLAPNVAREIVIDLQLPPSVEAYTVTRACASGLQAITDAVAKIERGEADVIIAGGSDSTSNATLAMPAEFVRAVAPVAMGTQKGVGAYFGALSQLLPPSRMFPKMPKVAERSTGEVMGDSAEKMAQIHGITRAEQDELATRSHLRAAAAWTSGRFEKEVTSVTIDGVTTDKDTIIRPDTSIEKMARLSPAFSKNGTLTAANSSTLTDGASATLIMCEEKARALGYTPLAGFRSWAYSGVSPREQVLKGPALSMPKCLDRAGMLLQDVGLVDMHEAFAAQVLSILKMLESPAFAREELMRSEAVGTVDPAILNVYGGSIAMGHPFAATGSRMVNTIAHALESTDKETALLGICAAGGLGASAILERV
ncbi:MAG TPA: acetyl-CoA C-acyltransferase [Myxococcales bacterium]|nr:acetyl-CoA C-acyltransferase [Myxococcales bacterium]